MNLSISYLLFNCIFLKKRGKNFKIQTNVAFDFKSLYRYSTPKVYSSETLSPFPSITFTFMDQNLTSRTLHQLKCPFSYLWQLIKFISSLGKYSVQYNTSMFTIVGSKNFVSRNHETPKIEYNTDKQAKLSILFSTRCLHLNSFRTEFIAKLNFTQRKLLAEQFLVTFVKLRKFCLTVEK